MHEDFGPWYSTVCFGDDAQLRRARWKGVCNVVGAADGSTVEGLLRLAHGSRQAPDGVVGRTVREAFKASDEAFQMSGNDRELQILAGTCLAVLMEEDKNTGSGCGSFGDDGCTRWGKAW